MLERFNCEWLEPWSPVEREKIFEDELKKEVGLGHALYGVKAEIVARREDRDDFLFKLRECRYRYAIVHLTFSKKAETDIRFPRVNLFVDDKDFIKRMKEDHEEY